MTEARDPGGPICDHVIRRNPGDLGRAMFWFRAVPGDAGYVPVWASLYGEPDMVLIAAALPALCDLMLAVLDSIEAERPPDLEALILLHLGVTWQAPPVCLPGQDGPPPFGRLWWRSDTE